MNKDSKLEPNIECKSEIYKSLDDFILNCQTNDFDREEFVYKNQTIKMNIYNNDNFIIILNKDIKEIPNINGLQKLDCSNCTNLKEIPNINGLQTLLCYNCPNIEEIPNINGLQYLDCYNCPFLKLSPELNQRFINRNNYIKNRKLLSVIQNKAKKKMSKRNCKINNIILQKTNLYNDINKIILKYCS